MRYLKQYYKKLSIRQKLLLLFSVQVIIPMVFMGVMLYKNTESIIQNKCVSYTADLLKMIELRLNDFAEDLTSTTDDMLYDQNMYTILETQEQNEMDEEIKEACYQSLRRVCKSNGKLQRVALAALDGRIYSYDLNAGGVNVEDETLPFESMLRTARSANRMPTWYFQPMANGEANLYLVRMIHDVDDFSEKGLMILQVNRDKLKNVYIDLTTEFMKSIQILSQDNNWIIGMDMQKMTQDEAKWLSKQGEEWNYKINHKTRQMIAYMNVPSTPWKIIARASLKELFSQEMDHFKMLFTLIMICTVLIVSIFSLLMAMDIIEPINRLVHSIRKVEQENVHEEVLVDREDELGYLSKCFNKMSGEIDNLLNRVYKEQLTRKESELKALQAQINPHFLFNTLESINWMAQLNNVPEIRDMVTALSALMEASIGKGSPMVPISKELKYIDSYLLIMKNRYGERLTYESHIDKSLLRNEVPKLILQPLVENAIYHGIDRTRKKGIITLTIEKQENRIYIEVKDNGKGMMPEEVIEMNQMFKEDNHDYLLGTNRKSIGLVNVNGRLKLFFGQEYGLEIESEYESYTKMKFYVPITDKGGN